MHLVLACDASLLLSTRSVRRSARTVRTTTTLPLELLDAADRVVRAGKARSRNDLLVSALRRELAAQERAAIDAAFAAHADDEEFQAESIALAEEAVQAGSAALQTGGQPEPGAKLHA